MLKLAVVLLCVVASISLLGCDQGQDVVSVQAEEEGVSPEATGTFKGVLLDSEGASIEGAVVSVTILATPPQDLPYSAKTKADGSFEITGIPAGDYGWAIYPDSQRREYLRIREPFCGNLFIEAGKVCEIEFHAE